MKGEEKKRKEKETDGKQREWDYASEIYPRLLQRQDHAIHGPRRDLFPSPIPAALHPTNLWTAQRADFEGHEGQHERKDEERSGEGAYLFQNRQRLQRQRRPDHHRDEIPIMPQPMLRIAHDLPDLQHIAPRPSLLRCVPNNVLPHQLRARVTRPSGPGHILNWRIGDEGVGRGVMCNGDGRAKK